MTERERKKLLIVDDHPVFRAGIKSVLDRTPGIDVAAEAESATEALRLLEKQSFDLVITDVSLEGKSGLELTRDIRALYPKVPVLALSMHEESLYAERALRAGALGYIMKKAGPAKLVEAVHQVLEGRIYLSPAMSQRLLFGAVRKESPGSGKSIALLTDREFEVFQHFADGKDGHQVASDLCLSIKTIDVHRANIRRKLDLKNAAELSSFAIRWRLSEGVDHEGSVSEGTSRS